MKAYVIYLSKISSSLESALETSIALKAFNFDVIMFEGTYGNEVEEVFKKENRKLYKPERYSRTKSNTLGAKGCFHSHYRLWQKCVELNEPIAIFEDDIVFKRTFEPIEFKDVLILTINYDWKITKQYRKYLELDFPIDLKVEYTNHPIPGAGGYVIKPNAAKKLVDEYKNYYLAADWAINTEICDVVIHPKLMGRTKTMDEKQSLTRSQIWK